MTEWDWLGQAGRRSGKAKAKVEVSATWVLLGRPGERLGGGREGGTRYSGHSPGGS